MGEIPYPNEALAATDLHESELESGKSPEVKKLFAKHEKWMKRALMVGTVAAGGLTLLLASPEVLRHIEEFKNAASSFNSPMVATITALVVGMGASLRAMAYGGWRKPDPGRETEEFEAWKKRVNYDERAKAVSNLGFEA